MASPTPAELISEIPSVVVDHLVPGLGEELTALRRAHDLFEFVKKLVRVRRVLENLVYVRVTHKVASASSSSSS